MIAVSVDGADDVDCIRGYVCFLCCGSASAPRLTAYLGGGIGSSIDVSANLLAIAFREYKAGLGFANESGFYTPYGGKAQVIDNNQKVCGLKRDGAKWSSKSPWTIGLEVSAIVNVGFSVDFKQIWDGLWH
jgi:hypothetical protein